MGQPPVPPSSPVIVHDAGIDALQGIDWREHRIDPRTVDNHVQAGTNTILPWVFPCAEVGSNLNHGTHFRCFIQLFAQFIQNFDGRITLGSPNASLKSFHYGFPCLASNANKGTIMTFLANCCSFCSGFGVYTPPPHLYTIHAHKGLWWELLHPAYRNQERFYDNALHLALTTPNGLDYLPVRDHHNLW